MLFKNESFIDKLKNNAKLGSKFLLGLGIAGTLVMTPFFISDNPYIGFKLLVSDLSSYQVKYNAEEFTKKYDNGKVQIAFSKDSHLSYSKKSGLKNTSSTAMYIAVLNKNAIEIKEIGGVIDKLTDNIEINKGITKTEENHFLSALPILTKFGFGTLKKEIPNDVKELINFDMDGSKPTLIYKNKLDEMVLVTMERYGILNDAKMIFLTQKQYEDKIKLDKDFAAGEISKSGVQYNGRIEQRLIGNTKYMILPNDVVNMISVNMDNGEKILTYQNTKGELKAFIMGDLNFNTEYVIVDKNNINIYNSEVQDSKSVNLHILNKLVEDSSSKANILKLDLEKDKIKKIISIDKVGSSLKVVIEKQNGDIYSKSLGMTVGLIESDILITHNTLTNKNVPSSSVQVSQFKR